MDNFAFELELLLKQTNHEEAPYTPGPPPGEPASPAIVDPSSAPPTVQTSDCYAGGMVHPPFQAIVGDDDAAVMAAIHRAPPFVEPLIFPDEGELGFTSMPDPFAPLAAAADDRGPSSNNSLPHFLEYSSAVLPAAVGAVREENMFFASDPVPMDFVGLDAAHARQASQMDHHPLQALFNQYPPAYLNPVGCGGGGGAEDGFLEPNWEAVEWYLAGQVRPGPDVARIYKCGICKMEFPNAQAYGGHMSSHSKTKKGETKPVVARKGKQYFKKTNPKPPKLTRPRPASPWVLPSNNLEANTLGEATSKNKIGRPSK